VDLRDHLMAQDAIYVGGGSLLNLLAIWRAHALDALLMESLEAGILICGQSAGAMCWFEQAITRSSGAPATAPGLGVLPGSACVHYGSDPDRRALFRRAVGSGEIPPGIGLEDQTAALYDDGQLVETVSAREGARVWRVTPSEEKAGSAGEGSELALDSRPIVDQRAPIDALSPEIVELRQTLAARAATRRSRRGVVGRLD
jgi:dipeptidase E